ncbi:MAG: ABC transporter permease [Candidatus Aminicenantes bacterium]|nr:ABC transporter permease [Candidatus Aminicenantes bacterium]
MKNTKKLTFDLEKAVQKWKKGLYACDSIEDSDITELESHLRDEIDQLKKEGFDLETSFRKAAEKSAAPESLREEYKKLRIQSNSRPFWHPSRFMPSLIWNTMKIAFRKIKAKKGFSIINISGLAVGMAACILILLWVRYELSYDTFHKNSGQIYRIITEDLSGNTVFTQAGSPAPLGRELVETVPEVLNAARVQSGWTNWRLHLEENYYLSERLAAVDPAFFEIFPFPFITGNPKTALQEKYSIVLTEELAKKIFGDEDPMGKTLLMTDTKLTVTGILKNIQQNSHLQFNYAFPAEHMRQWRESQLDSWTYTQFATYILLKEGADPDKVNQKMMSIIENKVPQIKGKARLYLQPLNKIHLHSKEINTWMLAYPNKGYIATIYIFSLTAFCILLLACINFMNLSTAQYSTRAKEVGMRKVVGARRINLIRQFLGESILLATTSLIIAVVLVEIFLPVFKNLTGKNITFFHSNNWSILIGVVLMGLVSGVIAGSYPALFLSSFRPVQVIQGAGRLGNLRGGTMRKIFVVLQFTFTIGLIIITSIIYLQLHYMNSKDLGYKTDNIVSFAGWGQYESNYHAAKAELLQNPKVLAVCRGFPPPVGTFGTTAVDWEGKDPGLEIKFGAGSASPDYLKVFNMKLADGRFFSWDQAGDNENWVLNETAVKAMGLENPIGKWFSYNGQKGTIIGILKDFHGESLHHPISPIAMHMRGGFFVFVKFNPGSLNDLMPFLTEKWKTLVSDTHPFRYDFVDERFAGWYQTEKRIGKIFQYFSYLTVFIAALGLFGLATFMAEQKTKEIGIRKVLGARISSILVLMTKEFTKWVLTANLIAWPIAYFVGKKWLAGYAYRISLGWEIFVLSAAAALAIAVLTVSYQSIRAATADPVQSLRYE